VDFEELPDGTPPREVRKPATVSAGQHTQDMASGSPRRQFRGMARPPDGPTTAHGPTGSSCELLRDWRGQGQHRVLLSFRGRRLGGHGPMMSPG